VRWLQTADGGTVEVQLSNDRKHWTPVGRGGDVPPGEWQTRTVDATARYVRFVFVATGDGARLGHLAEVEVYGPATAPAAVADHYAESAKRGAFPPAEAPEPALVRGD